MALTADGWVSSGLYDLPTVVTDYYDVNHGKTVDGSPYLVSDLPSTTYRRGAEDVTIAVVEPRSLGSGLQDFGSRVAASSTSWRISWDHTPSPFMRVAKSAW